MLKCLISLNIQGGFKVKKFKNNSRFLSFSRSLNTLISKQIIDKLIKYYFTIVTIKLFHIKHKNGMTKLFESQFSEINLDQYLSKNRLTILSSAHWLLKLKVRNDKTIILVTGIDLNMFVCKSFKRICRVYVKVKVPTVSRVKHSLNTIRIGKMGTATAGSIFRKPTIYAPVLTFIASYLSALYLQTPSGGNNFTCFSDWCELF